MKADDAPKPGDAPLPPHPVTPDGRYFVVRGRLWRLSDPALPPERREELVRDLMAARRDVRDARGDAAALRAARARVDAAKRALGERGPVWWTDGAPDDNRKLARLTRYADWWAAAEAGQEPAPTGARTPSARNAATARAAKVTSKTSTAR